MSRGAHCLAADLAAIALASAAGVLLARSWQSMRVQIADSRQVLALGQARAGSVLGSLDGYDPAGHPVHLTPAAGRLFVAFVVRPATAHADIVV